MPCASNELRSPHVNGDLQSPCLHSEKPCPMRMLITLFAPTHRVNGHCSPAVCSHYMPLVRAAVLHSLAPTWYAFGNVPLRVSLLGMYMNHHFVFYFQKGVMRSNHVRERSIAILPTTIIRNGNPSHLSYDLLACLPASSAPTPKVGSDPQPNQPRYNPCQGLGFHYIQPNSNQHPFAWR